MCAWFYSRIGSQIFEGRLSASQVEAALVKGKKKFETRFEAEARAKEIKDHEDKFNAFLAWIRNRNRVHRTMLMEYVRQFTEKMSPIALLRMEHIVKEHDNLTVYRVRWCDYQCGTVV